MQALTTIGLYCFLGTAMILTESRTSHAAGGSSPPQVDVEYRFQEGISLHEPVVVIFSVHNGLSEPITLTLGEQSRQYFQFSLTTKGHALQSYRNPGEAVDIVTVGSGKVEVAPGGDYEQPLLMNEWFKFDTAGTYYLTSRLTTSINLAGGGSFQPEGRTIPLIIKPRDTARLEKVCDELAKQVLAAKDVEQEREPALKLSYIDDPIAVPYMANVLSHRMFNYELAVLGLERIDDEAGVEVLLSALGR